MDRKSLIILLLSFIVLMGWYPLTNKLFPPHPVPTNAVVRTNISLGSVSNQPGATLTAAAPSTNVLVESSPAATNLPPVEERVETLETPDAIYTFSSLGGGLKLIELKKFPEVVPCYGARKAGTNSMVSLNTKAPVPAFALTQDGTSNTIRSYNLSKTGSVLRAETPLENGLVLIKEFRPSSNFMLRATIRYENRSAQPILLPERELVIGTATPIGQGDETMNLGFEWFNGADAEKITEPWFANATFGCALFGSNPRHLYRADATNVVWAAVHNQFFTMIAVPDTNTPVAGVLGRRVDLPPLSREELLANPRAFQKPFGLQTAFLLGQQTLAPQSFYQHSYDIYAGPKEYKTLSRMPKEMDRAMGFGFFGFFAKALLLSMNGIASFGIPYGITIIIITVIIKLLFWPLTTASTRSMKRMSALQPQMKALQEKYKDDPRKMNQKLMEFMKENKVNPMGGCLPLLLQIPVFIGFYQMLQSAIELRGAKFLWACDLSQPDTIAYIAGFPLNPLPLLMGATMLWQARLTPPSPGMDPAQQQMMRYMPLIMVVFLYNFSAGLALYWTTQNLLTIAQMKLTKTDDGKSTPKPGAPAPAPVKPIKKKS